MSHVLCCNFSFCALTNAMENPKKYKIVHGNEQHKWGAANAEVSADGIGMYD